MNPRWTLALALVAACKTAEPTPEPLAESRSAVSDASALPMPPGLDEAAMNPAINPCDDFYEYACGTWRKNTPIPPERATWSRGFDVISERNEDTLHEILEAIAHGKAPEGTPYAQALGDFYSACMDEPAHEQSLPKVKDELARLSAVPNTQALALALGRAHALGGQGAFTFTSAQDRRDASQVIGEADQGGLGLPDRDYYLKDAPRTVSIRQDYQRYVETMFGLLGQAPDQAKASAATVMEVETQLARAALSRVDRRDPERIYHRLDRAGLERAAPSFPWADYFKTLGIPDVQGINVTHPAYFQAIDAMVKSVKPAAWGTYLSWHYVLDHVPALPKRFQDASFAFTSKAFSGAQQDLPRWKKCVRLTDQAMGEALAVPFVTKTFGAEGKAKALELVVAIERSFERNLDTLEWMDAQTKARALQKLHKTANKIGYPDSWRRYDGLKVERASFLASLTNAAAFEANRQLGKIGKPLDRGEWLMTPPAVNAYSNPPLNEVVFPAGILQPPFFNRAATDAVNFGAMGVVAGHEITHGFDDEGRLFDEDGNLKSWWTETSNQRFLEKAACVREQFNGYTAIDELKVNGALTLGENAADLGGLKLSHAAMQASLKEKGEAGPRYRFNASQQFFLGFAQSWCSNRRPEVARVRAMIDPHSPPNLRVNGPLSNLPAFRQAFHCAEGSKMTRPKAEACEVW